MIARIFRPPLPGIDRTVLEIERALTELSGRTTTSANITGNATLTADNGTVLANATGGAIVVSLPQAATVPNRIYTVKKTDASANTVTIDPNGAETIDGAATKAISTQWASLTFQSNGAAWFII